MIGKRVRLVLDYPLEARGPRLTFNSGDLGIVVAAHPRWVAWIVLVNGTSAMFFPDELEEVS